jgi:hypothetical protein
MPVGGIVVYVRRSEYPSIAVSVLLGAIAAVVTWG